MVSLFKEFNEYIGIITLLVGLVAILVYYKQKADRKRDAARLILQEIRYAEQRIRIAKDRSGEYQLSERILPTNNWSNNIHLFIRKLEETEIDTISRFYAKCLLIDRIITVRVGQITSKNDTVNIVPPAGMGMSNTIGELSAVSILKEETDRFDFIYNSPALEKLREISTKDWFQLF